MLPPLRLSHPGVCGVSVEPARDMMDDLVVVRMAEEENRYGGKIKSESVRSAS